MDTALIIAFCYLEGQEVEWRGPKGWESFAACSWELHSSACSEVTLRLEWVI